MEIIVRKIGVYITRSLLRNIKIAFSSSLPMLVIYLLALFYLVPKHIGGLSAIMPPVHLAAVFIWAVLRPDDLSFILLALLGMIIDVATALPFGLSALTYTLFLLLIISQRRYIQNEGFATMWGYFALTLLLLQIMLWTICSLFYNQLLPISACLWQWLITALLYPLLHGLLYPLVEKLTRFRYRLLHA